MPMWRVMVVVVALAAGECASPGAAATRPAFLAPCGLRPTAKGETWGGQGRGLRRRGGACEIVCHGNAHPRRPACLAPLLRAARVLLPRLRVFTVGPPTRPARRAGVRGSARVPARLLARLAPKAAHARRTPPVPPIARPWQSRARGRARQRYRNRTDARWYGQGARGETWPPERRHCTLRPPRASTGGSTARASSRCIISDISPCPQPLGGQGARAMRVHAPHGTACGRGRRPPAV